MNTDNNLNFLLKNKINTTNAKFWLLLLSFSFFSIFAMGRESIDILAYGLWLYLSLYVLKKLSNKMFFAYLLFTFIVSAVYLPIAVMYGKINKGVIVSLYETNLQESIEFISVISIKSYIFLFLYIVVFIFLLKFNKRIVLERKVGKGVFVLATIIMLSIIVRPINNAIKEKTLSIHHLNSVNYYPLRQVIEINHRTTEYFKNKEVLRKARDLEPVWNFEEKALKYNTYVLIIGESMRRDYMSVYGYPKNTTPFLAKTNGVFFDNFISASQNTKLSLERMLFHNTAPEQSIMSNTPVTLANSLGMDTYWLSNQGVYGDFDVFASSVAVRANETHFLKQGQSSTVNHSDLEMLPKFDEILSRYADKNKQDGNIKSKFIVFHLMGSHPSFCKRIDPDYGIEDFKGYKSEDLSCYLTTYRQTDKLLEKIYQRLQATGNSFSMLYLSDHGLIHKNVPLKGVTLRHNTKFKQDYEVPFLTLSSDDDGRTHIKAERSGYYLVNALAEWFGVKERQLNLNPKFFSNVSFDQATQVFNGERLVDYNSLKEDPAIID